MKMNVSKKGIVNAADFSEVGPTSGLIAWYPLNGDTEDYTENRNNGVNHGATPTSGPTGGAYEFDGESTRVSVSGLDNIDLYGGAKGSSSFCCWVNSKETEDQNGFAQYMAGFHYFTIRDSSSNRVLRLMIRNVDDDVNFWPRSNQSINPNEWTHIVFIIEGGVGCRIYINGDLDYEVENESLGINDYGSSNIGRTHSDNFKGSISDVRIYNRALSSEEVKILYNATNGYGNTKVQQSRNGVVYVKGQFKEA